MQWGKEKVKRKDVAREENRRGKNRGEKTQKYRNERF